MQVVMLHFALKLLLIFSIKRPSFVTSNKVCYSFHGEGVNNNTATFIYESFFITECKTVNFNPVSLFELLLLLTRNVEIFPGPTPREILDLDALLKGNGLHIFHQNVRELLSNKDYLVD